MDTQIRIVFAFGLVDEHGGLPRRPVRGELPRDGPEFRDVMSKGAHGVTSWFGMDSEVPQVFLSLIHI